MRNALISATAIALAAAAVPALAQTSIGAAEAVQVPRDGAATSEPTSGVAKAVIGESTATPAAPSASESAEPASAVVSATVTSRTVTNGPVPDTAENRARYGAPMSNAGKRTTPAGN